ncbi:hypothetical protein BDZ89DRAFT_1072285 [Hymenopellis radicata]|nr:hypothetical protein BDZ89DRAFT_1072285 [Hymenopellis radicata]
MTLTFTPDKTPSLLDIATILVTVSRFTPNYDALASPCFHFALTVLVLASNLFAAPILPLPGAKQGIAKWAEVLAFFKIINHVSPEKNLDLLLSAYRDEQAATSKRISDQQAAALCAEEEARRVREAVERAETEAKLRSQAEAEAHLRFQAEARAETEAKLRAKPKCAGGD